MDDSVLQQFQSTFLLSGEIHDTKTPHPHYSLYKPKREGYGSQEARRKTFLEKQKSRRRDFADMARKIADGCEVSGEESEDEMEEGCKDEVDGTKVGVSSTLIWELKDDLSRNRLCYTWPHMHV